MGDGGEPEGAGVLGVGRELKKLGELLFAQVAIPQDLGKKSWSDSLTGVNGNDGCPAVHVAKEVVAALDANCVEAGFFQRGKEILALTLGSVVMPRR